MCTYTTYFYIILYLIPFHLIFIPFFFVLFRIFACVCVFVYKAFIHLVRCHIYCIFLYVSPVKFLYKGQENGMNRHNKKILSFLPIFVCVYILCVCMIFLCVNISLPISFYIFRHTEDTYKNNLYVSRRKIFVAKCLNSTDR